MNQKWAEGPKTYLGLMSSGFPNLFIITGPGSPAVLSNVIVSIEQHVEWIADYIAHLEASSVIATEADATAQEEWARHVTDIASETLYPAASSWYLGANIPGKPRVFMPYIGGVGTYRTLCDQLAAAGYEGFTHTRRPGREPA